MPRTSRKPSKSGASVEWMAYVLAWVQELKYQLARLAQAQSPPLAMKPLSDPFEQDVFMEYWVARRKVK